MVYIPGPLPGLNEIIAAAKSGSGRSNAYARLKKEWTERIAWQFKIQNLRPVKRAYFEFLWIEKNRQRDPDNISAGKKFVLDAMVEAGLMPKDGWRNVAGWADKFKIAGNGEEAGVRVSVMNCEIGLFDD